MGYRAYTHRAAGRLGLSGGVKNLPDGRVEVVAEGPKAKLEELLQLLKKGPPLSQVRDVEVIWTGAIDGYSEFAIWY